MCCKGFLKVMMFIFNGGIFLAGALILGVGVWVTVDSDSLLALLEDVEDMPDDVFQVVYVGYVLITVGALLLVIGFLGCCGAIKESRCMLLTFFSIVLIIFLIEVAAAVLLFVFSDMADDIFGSIEDKVRKTIKKNYGEKESMTKLWDETMKNLKCCGYKNYTDFEGSPFYTLNGDAYPPTCCSSLANLTCSSDAVLSSPVPGCFEQVVKLLEDNSVIIAGVAIGIAALEIAAMVVSMVLYCNAGKK